MRFYVLHTEQRAQRVADFIWARVKKTHKEYKCVKGKRYQCATNNTTAWAVPRQRVDGKWVVKVEPGKIMRWLTEEFDPDWFPTEE